MTVTTKIQRQFDGIHDKEIAAGEGTCGGRGLLARVLRHLPPLIILCGRDCGLTSDECDELLQQVMCEKNSF